MSPVHQLPNERASASEKPGTSSQFQRLGDADEESHDAKRLSSPLAVAGTITRAKKIEGVEVVLSGESELDDIGELPAVLRVAVGDEAGSARAVRLLDVEALQRLETKPHHFAECGGERDRPRRELIEPNAP